MKKLTIEITDIETLEAEYPELIKTVITKTVDRSKLRPLVNAMYSLGKQVDGVKAYYVTEPKSDTITLGELFDNFGYKGDAI